MDEKLKILVDIGHPAHVHFYSTPIKLWMERGHSVVITSRIKEMATDLLDVVGVKHEVLSEMNDGTKIGMFRELVNRDLALLKVVLREKPNVMTGIGGVYVAHVGCVRRIPSITFYDTENASLSNIITYPFTSLVAVPNCYQAWLPRWHLKYPGYHELSYLHPNTFTPSRDVAIICGLSSTRPTFLLRIVSWQASHDLTETGWSVEFVKKLVEFLGAKGKVIISSEKPLPSSLQQYQFAGPTDKIHHLMAYAAMYIGESATMASECAVLGVPAIYVAETGRGYTDEQEEKYGLVINRRNLQWQGLSQDIEKILEIPMRVWQQKREKLLNDKINVSEFVAELVENFPDSLGKYKSKYSQ